MKAGDVEKHQNNSITSTLLQAFLLPDLSSNPHHTQSWHLLLCVRHSLMYSLIHIWCVCAIAYLLAAGRGAGSLLESINNLSFHKAHWKCKCSEYIQIWSPVLITPLITPCIFIYNKVLNGLIALHSSQWPLFGQAAYFSHWGLIEAL